MGAEGIQIRGVDFNAVAANKVSQIVFFIKLLQAAIGGSGIRGALNGHLLVCRQAVPGLLREGDVVQVDEVGCQGDLLGYLVELGVYNGGQRVVLTVNSTRRQGGVDFGECHRSRRCTECLAKELPGVGAGHPQVYTRQICRGHDILLVTREAQVHVATPKIHDRQQLYLLDQDHRLR